MWPRMASPGNPHDQDSAYDSGWERARDEGEGLENVLLADAEDLGSGPGESYEEYDNGEAP